MNRIYSPVLLALITLGLMILTPVGRPAHATSAVHGARLGSEQSACQSLTLTPTIQLFPAAGGIDTFTVDTGSAGDQCSWQAVPTDGWITVDSSPRAGDETLTYSVAANTGLSRTGFINIVTGGTPGSILQTLRINQDGKGVLICGAGGFLDIDPFGTTISRSFEMPDGLIIIDGLLKVSADPILDSCEYFLTSPTGVRELIGTGRSATFVCPPQPYSTPFSDSGSFVGQSAKGVWTLEVHNPSSNFGRLLCWCVEIIGVSNGIGLHVAGEGGGGGFKPFSPATITATVVANGSLVGGAQVSFVAHDTTMSNPFPDKVGQSVTDSLGVAAFVYDRPDQAEDVITVQAQINGHSLGAASTTVAWGSHFGNCPSSQAMSGSPGAASTLTLLRKFRDDNLSRTTRGRQYTRLYYKFSPEVVRIMMFNPMLMLRSREMIKRYEPVIQSMEKGEQVMLTTGDLDDIEGFLNDLASKAGPELQDAIVSARRDLRDRAVHAEFKITVSSGPKREQASRHQHQGSGALGLLSIFLGACAMLVGGRPSRRRRALRGAKLLLALMLGLASLINWFAPSYASENQNGRRTTLTQAVGSSPWRSLGTQVAVETDVRLPLVFEANQGQADPRVRFLSRGRGYDLLLAPTEAMMVLKSREAAIVPPALRRGRLPLAALSNPGLWTSELIPGRRAFDSPLQTPDSRLSSGGLRMKLIGSNPDPQMEGLGPLPGKTNYFIGNDPARWREGVASYTGVKCWNVYPGIDMAYYGSGSELEYDFTVAPGADPAAVKLAVDGAERISINARGDLVLRSAHGTIIQRKPDVYQEATGGITRVAAGYILRGAAGSKPGADAQELKTENSKLETAEVAFGIGAYDRSRPLIIDPVLAYSTYLGGSGDDEGNTITVDQQGNAYVTGLTSSTNFPASAAEQTTSGGGQDAFVAKLDPKGQLVYSTYLGGNGQDNASAVAVDASGNAYVTGFTGSSNFPTRNPIQAAKGGPFNAFVVKLSPTGSLLSSTYLGGSVGDYGSSITLDAAGSIYLAGVATSPNFPTLNAAQPVFGGAADVYVAKLNSAGTQLMYSTYLGGGGNDGATGIAVDSGGSAYITGVTSSTNFPTASPLQAVHGGGIFDAFVARLNPSGSKLVYSTYLGGSGEDRGFRIAVDSSGDAYVAGDTDSANFPTVNPLQKSNAGSGDAFVARLDPTGAQLIYSTYLGGSGIDGATCIALDSAGDAYVTGYTSSNNFPTAGPLQPAYGGGSFDAFVAILNPSGSALDYSSYVGGGGIDAGFGIAVDSGGNAYIMGQTDSANFPTANAAQSVYGGGVSDVFIAKMRIGPLITGAQVSGKRLLVSGIGFDGGATILINSDPQRTANDGANPTTALVSKKGGKLINQGQTVTLQVKDGDGVVSPPFSFTRQ